MRGESRRRTILVVDDEPSIREVLSRILREAGYQVLTAGTPEEARALPFDAALLDLRLPGVRGFSLLKELKAKEPGKPILMISGQGTIRAALEAVSLGAFDFLEKPLSKERVLLTLRNALKSESRGRELALLREKEAGQGLLLGGSRIMAKLRAEVARVASSDARVLILGESGTGKELIARSIHEASRRKSGPFIRVNCAAIPENLIESEMFGHEKGAFTGAGAAKPGRFELADGGSLLLDEVGDLQGAAQAKLLRVLQEGEVERVGGSQTRRVDVRVLSATHQDLPSLVRKGVFREDLYFRLHVIPLRSPALREHPEDIPDLVQHFIAEYSQGVGGGRRSFSPGALNRLERYPWPGNVRELKNVVERALILAPGMDIGEADLPADLAQSRRRSGPVPASLGGVKALLERNMICEALAKTGGNVLRAAKLLGVERSNLHKKMKRFDISRREIHG